MMEYWTIYDPITGEIFGVIAGSDSIYLESQMPDGSSILPGNGNMMTEYVVNGDIVPRLELDSFDHTDPVSGCEYQVWNEVGDTMRILPGEEPANLTDPGTYRFAVTPPFPFMPFDTEVIIDA